MKFRIDLTPKLSDRDPRNADPSAPTVLARDRGRSGVAKRKQQTGGRPSPRAQRPQATRTKTLRAARKPLSRAKLTK